MNNSLLSLSLSLRATGDLSPQEVESKHNNGPQAHGIPAKETLKTQQDTENLRIPYIIH